MFSRLERDVEGAGRFLLFCPKMRQDGAPVEDTSVVEQKATRFSDLLGAAEPPAWGRFFVRRFEHQMCMVSLFFSLGPRGWPTRVCVWCCCCPRGELVMLPRKTAARLRGRRGTWKLDRKRAIRQLAGHPVLGMAFGLEAFSREPPRDSIGALAFQQTPETRGVAWEFLSYYPTPPSQYLRDPFTTSRGSDFLL